MELPGGSPLAITSRSVTLSEELHTPSSAQRQHVPLETGGNTPAAVQPIILSWQQIQSRDLVSRLTAKVQRPRLNETERVNEPERGGARCNELLGRPGPNFS